MSNNHFPLLGPNEEIRDLSAERVQAILFLLADIQNADFFFTDGIYNASLVAAVKCSAMIPIVKDTYLHAIIRHHIVLAKFRSGIQVFLGDVIPIIFPDFSSRERHIYFQALRGLFASCAWNDDEEVSASLRGLYSLIM